MKPTPAQWMKYLKTGKEEIVSCRSLCWNPEEVLPSVISGAFQVHSRTFRVNSTTPMLSWLCAEDMFAGRWTFGPVWGPEWSASGFYQAYLCTLVHLAFPQSWSISLSQLLQKKTSKKIDKFCLSWTSGMMEATVLLGAFTVAELFVAFPRSVFSTQWKVPGAKVQGWSQIRCILMIQFVKMNK